jgi:putative chitinase
MDWRRVILAISPHAKADIVSMIADHADEMFEKYKLTSRNVQADLLAHASVESAGFTRLEEDLSYSAQRLCKVWPSRFHSLAQAEPYSHNPKALALKVYDGRMGNRPGSEDGWIFRGKGGLETTGRENTERLAKKLGITAEEAADWLTDPDHMFECVCATYVLVGAVPYGQRGDIVGSTKHVNGGEEGLADRESALRRAKAALVKFSSGETADADSETSIEPKLSKAQVRGVQQRLKDLKFFPGKIDGDLAPLTRSGIRDFQDANGLKTTGLLDDDTRAALDAATTPAKVLPDDRASATVDDLRQDGSATIAATDDTKSAVTKIAAAGTAAVASVGSAASQSGASLSDINDQIKSTADTASSVGSAVSSNSTILIWLAQHWQLPLGALLLSVAGYFAWKAYKSADATAQQRLADHQSGANLGR